MTRSKRSYGPEKSRELLSEVEHFHWRVRTWLGEIPIGAPIYIGLSILKAVLHTVGNTLRGDTWRLYEDNGDGGEPPQLKSTGTGKSDQ